MQFSHFVLFVLIIFGFNKSYAFIEMFDNDTEESEVIEVKQEVPQEVIEKLNKYRNEAEIYFKEKNIESAIERSDKILSLIELYNLQQEKLDYYLFLTKINYYQHDNIALLDNLNSAMLIAIELDDQNKLAYIYTRMGYTHFRQANYFLAKSLLNQASSMYLNLGNESALVETYYNLNIISIKLNKDEEAKEYKEKYDSLIKQYPNTKIFRLTLEENQNRYLNLRDKFTEKGFIEADFVEIQILNKITARVYKFSLKIGEELSFESINITPRSCWKTPSDALPNNYAFFSVVDNKTYENVFYGWILSNNPSLNSMAHQFYNISLRNCITQDLK